MQSWTQSTFFFFNNYARNSYWYISLHFQRCYACGSWFGTRTVLFSSWWNAAGNLWNDVTKFLSLTSLLLCHQTFTQRSVSSVEVCKFSPASGPSILLTFNRLTATTMSDVSALILPKSQLHLDYNSTDKYARAIFNLNALSCCKVYLIVMKLRPQANAGILYCIPTSRADGGVVQGDLRDCFSTLGCCRGMMCVQLPPQFQENTTIFCFIPLLTRPLLRFSSHFSTVITFTILV